MDTREYRSAIQQTIRAAYLARLANYLELVDESRSPEDHRKCVELLAKLSDAYPEADEGKKLPTVQISIGGMVVNAAPQANTQAGQALPVVDATPLTWEPTDLMREALVVNLDIEPLLLERPE